MALRSLSINPRSRNLSTESSLTHLGIPLFASIGCNPTLHDMSSGSIPWSYVQIADFKDRLKEMFYVASPRKPIGDPSLIIFSSDIIFKHDESNYK